MTLEYALLYDHFDVNFTIILKRMMPNAGKRHSLKILENTKIVATGRDASRVQMVLAVVLIVVCKLSCSY